MPAAAPEPNLSDLLAQQAEIADKMSKVPRKAIALAISQILNRPHIKAAVEELLPLISALPESSNLRREVGGFIHFSVNIPKSIETVITMRPDDDPLSDI